MLVTFVGGATSPRGKSASMAAVACEADRGSVITGPGHSDETRHSDQPSAASLFITLGQGACSTLNFL